MPLYTSSREKHLWLWAFAVFAAILSTLFVGQPLASTFGNQDIQAAIFLFGMLLIGAAIIIHAFRTKPTKFEIVILLGISAVYIMLFLRLGILNAATCLNIVYWPYSYTRQLQNAYIRGNE